jgi:hypothetical protein
MRGHDGPLRPSSTRPQGDALLCETAGSETLQPARVRRAVLWNASRFLLLGLAVGLATTAAAYLPARRATAMATGRRGFDLSGDLNVEADPLAYLVCPLGDLLSFAVFVAAAFWYRRQPAVHQRLMVLATAGSLMGAPLAHLIGHYQALREIPAPGARGGRDGRSHGA